MRRPCLLVLSSMACASSCAAVAAPSSVYTRHDYSACPEGRSSEPDVVTIRVCSGPGGMAVTLTADPDASALSFGRKPLVEDLDIGSFFEAGGAIEWRAATETGGRLVAAIVRYRVGASVGALTESRLVVYRLEPSGRSCVMGVAREPGANVKAREIADGSAASFVCGTSRRIMR